MTTYDQQIKEIYEEIFALDTIAKQQEALRSWWKYLELTCEPDDLCIECLRQEEECEGA
jgi:uncharacterized protein